MAGRRGAQFADPVVVLPRTGHVAHMSDPAALADDLLIPLEFPSVPRLSPKGGDW